MSLVVDGSLFEDDEQTDTPLVGGTADCASASMNAEGVTA
jgi:hypothetical protein